MDQKIKRTCSVKRDKGDTRAYKIDLTIDYEHVDVEQVIEWSTSHLVINAQRVLRTKSGSELEELEREGYYIQAQEAGRGATRDPIAAFKRKFAGMTPEEKRAAIDDLESLID